MGPWVKSHWTFALRWTRALSATAVVFVAIGVGAAKMWAKQAASGTAVPSTQQGIAAAKQEIQRDQTTDDWLERVKKSVAGHDLKAALGAVDARLAAEPDDSDAAGWRAQLLAWTGRREEAEAFNIRGKIRYKQ